jgi:hypothetical protein
VTMYRFSSGPSSPRSLRTTHEARETATPGTLEGRMRSDPSRRAAPEPFPTRHSDMAGFPAATLLVTRAPAHTTIGSLKRVRLPAGACVTPRRIIQPTSRQIPIETPAARSDRGCSPT